MRTRDIALPTAMNAAAVPTRTATDAAQDAGWGLTPVWNPMIVLAIFYAVLFLVFVGAVAFIVVRRRRRALAYARAEAAAAAPTHPTTTTAVGQDPEKDGEARGSVSGESDTDGFDDANKTVTIAHAGAGECKSLPPSDGTGTGTKRYYTCDGPSEDWTTPPLRSVRFSSRTWTQTSLPYHSHVSDLSVAQRETSQVLVWLPSFQSNAGGATRPASAAGTTRVEEGEECSEKGSGKEQEQEQEQEQGSEELTREQERGREGLKQEREETSAKEDSDTEYGMAQ